MLIHSVTPPHMLSEKSGYPEINTKRFGGGYIEGFDTPQGFRVSRLLSTDPNLYLNEKYMPGQIVGKK